MTDNTEGRFVRIDEFVAESLVWEAIDMYSLVRGNPHLEPWYVEEQKVMLAKALDEYRKHAYTSGHVAGWGEHAKEFK